VFSDHYNPIVALRYKSNARLKLVLGLPKTNGTLRLHIIHEKDTMLSADWYPLIKSIHMATAVISILGFATRGVLMAFDAGVMKQKWIRIVPHINDTLLLAAAIWLMFFLHRYPFADAWVTAKLIGLVAYVLFGTWALRKGKSLGSRLIFFVLALGSAGYILAIAITKSITLNLM